MNLKPTLTLVAAAALVMLAGCGEVASLPVAAGTGANPTLPPPHKTLLPTVNIAPAKGWSEGAMPTAAAGTQVNAFAGQGRDSTCGFGMSNLPASKLRSGTITKNLQS